MRRFVLILPLLWAACSSNDGAPNPGGSTVVPDFLLVDVNPNSTTTGQDVSPRDYTTRISAWYFGAAT